MAILDANAPEYGLHISRLADIGQTTAPGIWTRGSALNTDSASKGEVRHYAGGKRRAITWGALDRTTEVSMEFNTVEDMKRIASWIDQLVVVRSIRGEVIVGLLANITTTAEAGFNIGWQAGSLTIMQTTDDGTLEGVRRR